MGLVGNPIPDLDHVPHAFGAPPGVEVDFDHFRQWDDPFNPWWTNRPVIAPIGSVLHTNAASVEALIASSMNFGNSSRNATKPHYNVNRQTPGGPWAGPVKCVPSDRRAIANSTGSSVEYEYGCPDSSFWLLAIESADAGGNVAVDGDYGDFIADPDRVDHDEIVARIFAYESMVHGYRLRVPTQFFTDGIYTHTEPWGYPYLTTKRGKTCPTDTKKDRVLRGDIIPRAIEIANYWGGDTPPPSGDDNMKRSWPNRIDSRDPDGFHGSLKAGEVRSVWIAEASLGMPASAMCTVLNVAVIPHDTKTTGHVAVWPSGEYAEQVAVGNTATVTWDPTGNESNNMMVPLDGKGHLLIRATGACDFVIDIPGLYSD